MGNKNGGEVAKIGSAVRRLGHMGWAVLYLHVPGKGWIARARRQSEKSQIQVEASRSSLGDTLNALEAGCAREWKAMIAKEKREADSVSMNSQAENGISSSAPTNESRASSSVSDTETLSGNAAAS